MPNFPGPWEVRINYIVISLAGTRPHSQRFSLDMNTAGDPGDTFADFNVLSRDSSNPALDAWLDAYIDLVREIYHTDTTFVDAELWKYTPESFDAAFYATYAIGLAGLSASGTTADGQGIMTFRSQNGGSARLNFMETIAAAGATTPIASATAAVQDIADYITDPGSPVIARDNGYLFTALNWLPGLNEGLFKDRFR